MIQRSKAAVSARQVFILAATAIAVFCFSADGLRAASYISGFNANGDVGSAASGNIAADDNVTITVDNDNGGAGSFNVIDRNAGAPITVMSGDGQNLTLGSNATGVSGTLSVTGNMTANGSVNTVGTVGSANTLTGASNSFSATNTNSITATVTNSLSAANNTIGATNTNSITATVSNTMNSDLNVIGNAATYAGATEAIRVDGGTGVSIKGAAFAVNTSNAVATTNTIGSNNAATTVDLIAGNSNMALANDTARTVVAGGTSVVGSGTTTSAVSLINKGGTASHAELDALGNISMVTTAATQASAAVTLTNGAGITHGIVVTEDRTVISGGIQSTTLTLDDNGATFRNPAGNPAQVTGVADGKNDYDAVNVRQLNQAFSGIASVAALAAIPAPAPGDNFSVGMGYGHFRGANAMAVGLRGRVLDNMTISGGLGYGTTDSAVTPNLGIAFSW